MRLRDRLLVACFIVMCLLGSWRFGGGQAGRADVPSGAFGPINGVQWVKDNAVPIQPSQPGGAIIINPGGFTQTALNNGGAGATFWLTAGTHSVPSHLAPLQNQKIYCAAGAVIDGGNTSSSALLWSSSTGVQIHGGTLQNQGNASSPSFAAAILAGGGSAAGSWLVQDATVKNNWNVAIKFQAPNCIARRCLMDNNGRYGPNCSENATGETYTGIMFEHCEWKENNSRQLNPGANAGGSKFLHCPGLIVQYCNAHDNWGFGIWTDVPNIAGNIWFLENVAEANRWGGLFMEGVLGGCRINRNYALNNGYYTSSIGGAGPTKEANAQIRVTHADSSLGPGIRGDVFGNDVDFNLTQSGTNGQALIVWNHNPPHPNQMRNWDIHGNRFWFRTTDTQRILALDQDPEGTQVWDGDIDFFDNEYHVAGTSSTNYFTWGIGGDTGAAKNYLQWQVFHPGDNLQLVLI